MDGSPPVKADPCALNPRLQIVRPANDGAPGMPILSGGIEVEMTGATQRDIPAVDVRRWGDEVPEEPSGSHLCSSGHRSRDHKRQDDGCLQ